MKITTKYLGIATKLAQPRLESLGVLFPAARLKAPTIGAENVVIPAQAEINLFEQGHIKQKSYGYSAVNIQPPHSQ